MYVLMLKVMWTSNEHGGNVFLKQGRQLCKSYKVHQRGGEIFRQKLCA